MDIGIHADGLSTSEFEKFAIELVKKKFEKEIDKIVENIEKERIQDNDGRMNLSTLRFQQQTDR